MTSWLGTGKTITFFYSVQILFKITLRKEKRTCRIPLWEAEFTQFTVQSEIFSGIFSLVRLERLKFSFLAFCERWNFSNSLDMIFCGLFMKW